MASHLEQRIVEMREIFGFFERNGQMPVVDLPTALRALNLNPGERQLEELKKSADSGSGMLDFVRFQEVALPLMDAEPDNKEMILNAFRVFDKDGTGYLPTSELKGIMTTLGEKYSSEEFDELVRGVDRDGRIRYEELADRMLMTYQQLGNELAK
eukprot:TRINITY_DN1563_c0_g1_i1.p1 TRINITY_DN1563_c0_g1~~TRINITY_DN1563_c0_g1_i1.p1  ORF type:complete len:155 (-),score=38.01 TRINITY_DN1563_c0_g1_i1:4-468(-)